MSILGASLEDLEQLSSQLHTTGSSIERVAGDTSAAVNGVVAQLRDAGSRAVASAGEHMEALRAAVDQAQARADGASWIGRNAEVFRDAHRDFGAAMARADEATRAYFDELRRVLEQLGADTEQYLGELTASLRNAHASTESMARAVDAQRDNLDQVMNTGMSAG
jgi:ABC-type transporter Mla subunit MlaD